MDFLNTIFHLILNVTCCIRKRIYACLPVLDESSFVVYIENYKSISVEKATLFLLVLMWDNNSMQLWVI